MSVPFQNALPYGSRSGRVVAHPVLHHVEYDLGEAVRVVDGRVREVVEREAQAPESCACAIWNIVRSCTLSRWGRTIRVYIRPHLHRGQVPASAITSYWPNVTESPDTRLTSPSMSSIAKSWTSSSGTSMAWTPKRS